MINIKNVEDLFTRKQADHDSLIRYSHFKFIVWLSVSVSVSDSSVDTW